MARITVSQADVQIGQTIRNRRVALKLSQAELGAALGVTFQQVQKYERGANRISALTLLRASQALQCSVADLYGDPDPTGHSPSERAILKIWANLNQPERDAVAAMLREFSKRRQAPEDLRG
jgi:transcriptional regulator with XRE-family HTH domain